MEIILLKDLEKVGNKHEIVTVKNGFGRNYLIPQKLGVIANSTNLQKLEKIKAKETAKETARLDEYKAIAEILEGKSLKIAVKAGTTGKIFGSVTSVQLSQALKKQLDIDIDRKKISLPEEIIKIGTYTAVLNLHPDVETKIDFELIQD